MSGSAIERLIQSQAVLLRALNSGDITELEQATSALATALDAVRDEAPMRIEEHVRIDYALLQARAAFGRVNFLTHRARRQGSRLSLRRGDRVVETYQKGGKPGQTQRR